MFEFDIAARNVNVESSFEQDNRKMLCFLETYCFVV